MGDEPRTSRLNDDMGGDDEARRRAADAKLEAEEPGGIRRAERSQRTPRDDDEFITDAELDARVRDRPLESDDD